MGPGGVVAEVVFDEILGRDELCGGPEAKFQDEVLAVGPDVVVFGVLFEHTGDECDFRLGEAFQYVWV